MAARKRNDVWKHHTYQDIVWWSYDYTCANPECKTHGYVTLADNVNAEQPWSCSKCDKPVTLCFLEKYRHRSVVITPAVIEYSHIPVE